MPKFWKTWIWKIQTITYKQCRQSGCKNKLHIFIGSFCRIFEKLGLINSDKQPCSRHLRLFVQVFELTIQVFFPLFVKTWRCPHIPPYDDYHYGAITALWVPYGEHLIFLGLLFFSREMHLCAPAKQPRTQLWLWIGSISRHTIRLQEKKDKLRILIVFVPQ